MSEHAYKVVELVGSSTSSIEDAIQTAIRRTDQSLRNLRWFEVVQRAGRWRCQCRLNRSQRRRSKIPRLCRLRPQRHGRILGWPTAAPRDKRRIGRSDQCLGSHMLGH